MWRCNGDIIGAKEATSLAAVFGKWPCVKSIVLERKHDHLGKHFFPYLFFFFFFTYIKDKKMCDNIHNSYTIER